MNWNGNTVLVNTAGEHWPHKNGMRILSNYGDCVVWWTKWDCYKHRQWKQVAKVWIEEGEERTVNVIYYFFFCACVWYVSICVLVHVCTCMWRLEADTGYHPWSFSTFCFETRSQAPAIGQSWSPPLLPSMVVIDVNYQTGLAHMCWVSKPVLKFMEQALYPGNTAPPVAWTRCEARDDLELQSFLMNLPSTEFCRLHMDLYHAGTEPRTLRMLGKNSPNSYIFRKCETKSSAFLASSRE